MIKTRINNLKSYIIQQSKNVEKMLDICKNMMDDYNEESSEKLENLETMVNENEKDIEEDVMHILARFSPEAKNLRTVLMILKMNNDLERIGDLAVNISESISRFDEFYKLKSIVNLIKMFNETILMFHNSIQAFFNEDEERAFFVCKNDDIIDDIEEKILRDLIEYMIKDGSNVKNSLEIIRISRHLERIADHCTNIAEQTIYIKKGKDIKHQNCLE